MRRFWIRIRWNLRVQIDVITPREDFFIYSDSYRVVLSCIDKVKLFVWHIKLNWYDLDFSLSNRVSTPIIQGSVWVEVHAVVVAYWDIANIFKFIQKLWFCNVLEHTIHCAILFIPPKIKWFLNRKCQRERRACLHFFNSFIEDWKFWNFFWMKWRIKRSIS